MGLISIIKKWAKKMLGVKQPEDMFYRLRILPKLGYHPTLVVDIGAYVGQWTIETLNIFQTARFVMVEPQRSKSAILRAIAEHNSNVTVFHCLLGSHKSMSVPFYEMETGSSIYPEQTNVGRTEVNHEMTTLDDLIDLNPHDSVFLKLDVQGAELDILKGAKNCLSKTEFVLLEASLLNYNSGAPQFAEVVAFMHKIGFVVLIFARQDASRMKHYSRWIFFLPRSIHQFEKPLTFFRTPLNNLINGFGTRNLSESL